MRERIRNGLAIAIAAVCLVLGIYSLLIQRPPFSGVTLRFEGTTLMVATIDPAVGVSDPDFHAGAIVTEVEGFKVDGLRPELADQAIRGDFSELGIADPTYGTKQFTFDLLPSPPIGFTLVVGVGLFLGIATWVGRGYAGNNLGSLAIPLAAASATPLILVASWAPLNIPLLVCAVGLPTVARLVLADYFIERTVPMGRCIVAATVAVGSTAGYVILVVGYYGLSAWGLLLSQIVSPVAVAPAFAITVVPAILFLRSQNELTTKARAEDAVAILFAALTPVVITFGYLVLGLGVSVPLLWLLVVVIVLQTNARVATLRIQRDTVVAATEIERARLAADLHDDALQEMTVLVRRLDDVGDADAAALARSIADRLREVCGDLRLPILDELGAGPALEWLVARVGETSGRQVLLERVDGARPPADVELAVFRVAQEALANAVTHGEPPITVRYAAGETRASLSITDHGAGLSTDAAAVAGRSGHYGLLNMRQRAEQVGAKIEFRRPADGGTVVGLDWAVG